MPTVLVVEDDRDFRELEREVLQASGYLVITASNGAEALEILHHQRPCVILLDLMMPVMDGLTFLNERRLAVPEAAGVPVICVSAAGKALTSEAAKRGAVQCVTKPTNIDELCDLVDRYCTASA
jgi:CheY-like chemotaxis protein